MQDYLTVDDITVKFITPANVKVGWDEALQIRRQGAHAAIAPEVRTAAFRYVAPSTTRGAR